MGILETRNLDFRNVILLSMNDDNFPGSVVTGTSFIPYNLRAAYALPTPEHHEGFTPTIFIVCCNGRERADALLRSCRRQDHR